MTFESRLRGTLNNVYGLLLYYKWLTDPLIQDRIFPLTWEITATEFTTLTSGTWTRTTHTTSVRWRSKHTPNCSSPTEAWPWSTWRRPSEWRRTTWTASCRGRVNLTVGRIDAVHPFCVQYKKIRNPFLRLKLPYSVHASVCRIALRFTTIYVGWLNQGKC